MHIERKQNICKLLREVDDGDGDDETDAASAICNGRNTGSHVVVATPLLLLRPGCYIRYYYFWHCS